MYEYGADKVYDFLIVASGVNSANPHWRASKKVIESGNVVTFDYVASYEGYYGDETRTVFYKSIPGKKLKEIYEIVLESQVSAIDIIEPGVKASEVDAKARKIIEDAGYGKYFIHSTGHGVGLEVHEKPRLSKNDDSILDEGFVVTVEPGIYIPGLGGVRIEDMVLVTKKGHKLLTKLNKAIQVIE
jgi:Xaa-Pro aminopeptidase